MSAAARSLPPARSTLLLAAAALLAAMTLLTGCATRGGSIPYNPTYFRSPDAPPPAIDLQAYKLSPGDVINVRVYELENLTGDQTVDGTGRITFPLIGTVIADGKTTAQFENDVATLLKANYLQAPHVVVALKTPVTRTVTVDGAVQQPGVYAIAPTTTLVQTVALAHGLSNDSNPRRVIIFRQIGGVRKAAAFDLITIRNGKDADPQIYPSDVIVVDGSSLNEGYRTLLRTIPLLAFISRF